MNECHVCGAEMRDQHADVTVKTTNGPVVVGHVPARVCPRCGTETFAIEVMLRLQAIQTELETGQRVPDAVEMVPRTTYRAA